MTDALPQILAALFTGVLLGTTVRFLGWLPSILGRR